DPATLKAYRETEYHVHGPAPFTLRVDEHSEALARLHAAHGVRSSAFITAWNPRSEAPEGDSNEARQARLERALRDRGLDFLNGIGQHPSNEWEGEPSFLVLGLACKEACALGRDFEQNAILFADEDAVPELV